MRTAHRQMKIGLFLRPHGHHIAAWRHPDTPVDYDANIAPLVAIARIAEHGLFDMIFSADEVAVPHADARTLMRTSDANRIDPFTMLTALAMVTKHIGLVCTATTTYDEPFFVARRFASLDLVSGGRSGWNMVTSGVQLEAANFGRAYHPAKTDRYLRAREFIDIVRGLWDSWDDDAFLRDKASGQFFDPNKVHVLDHQGEQFKVRGPLNVERSPQGQPVLVQAGQSDDGRDIAAETSDIVFTAQHDLVSARAFYTDIKARAAKRGRNPDDVKIMPGLLVMVGQSDQEARDKLERLQHLIDPAMGVTLLSKYLGFDLGGVDIDGPLPEIPKNNVVSTRSALLQDIARRENLTVRKLYERVAGSRGHFDVVGTPAHVADQMEEWFTTGAADGFNFMPMYLPTGVSDFVELVVPELQRRGLYRTAYEGKTLRENLGLPQPMSVHNRSPSKRRAADALELSKER